MPHFYADWLFWQWAVALTALLFSVGPTLLRLFRPPNLMVNTYDRITLSHFLGNPNAVFFVMLSNRGARPVRVSAIRLLLARDQDRLVLPAKTFVAAGSTTDLVLAPFELGARRDWTTFVTFFEPFSRDDDRTSRRLISALRDDINEQRKHLANEKELVDAAPEHVRPLVNFFESHFRWLPGEYTATLAVTTDPPKWSASSRFRFTLFESDSQELRAYTDKYKIGLGVYYADRNQQPGVSAPVTPQ